MVKKSIILILALLAVGTIACGTNNPKQTVQAYLQAFENEDFNTMDSLKEENFDGYTRATPIAISAGITIIISDLEVTLITILRPSINQSHSTASVSASYHLEERIGDTRIIYDDMSEVYTLTNISGKWLISDISSVE